MYRFINLVNKLFNSLLLRAGLFFFIAVKFHDFPWQIKKKIYVFLEKFDFTHNVENIEPNDCMPLTLYRGRQTASMKPTCICGSSSFFALSIIAMGVDFNSCCSRSPCWKNSSATSSAVFNEKRKKKKEKVETNSSKRAACFISITNVWWEKTIHLLLNRKNQQQKQKKQNKIYSTAVLKKKL